MKKIFIALSLLVVFNCEDDLTNKTPVFQATVNGNNQWIAEDFIATIQITSFQFLAPTLLV